MKGTQVSLRFQYGGDTSGTIVAAGYTTMFGEASHIYVVNLDKKVAPTQVDKVVVRISLADEEVAKEIARGHAADHRAVAQMLGEGVAAEKAEKILRDTTVGSWVKLDNVAMCKVNIRTLNGMAGTTIYVEQ